MSHSSFLLKSLRLPISFSSFSYILKVVFLWYKYTIAIKGIMMIIINDNIIIWYKVSYFRNLKGKMI